MNNPLTPSPSIAIESSSKRARQIPILLGAIGLLQFLPYIAIAKFAFLTALVWAGASFSLATFIYDLENKKRFNKHFNELKEKILYKALILVVILLAAAIAYMYFQLKFGRGDGFDEVIASIFSLLFIYGLQFGGFVAGFVFIQTRYFFTVPMLRSRMIATFLIPLLATIWLIFA